jgi:hypothetical protein
MYEYGHPPISKSDQIKAYLNYGILMAKTYPYTLLSFRKTFRNYLSLAYRVSRNKYPIVAKLHNGTERRYNQPREIWFDIAHISYDNSDIVTINDLKFIGGLRNGDLYAIFIDKQYDILSVKDKAVLDIGANIADSSIYFVKRGARKVYAIEPNQKLYQMAYENISLNSMSDCIELVLAACSSKKSMNSYPPFISLDELIRSCNIAPEILKVDCEGCEYDIVMNADDSLLRSFERILVEYHYGYRGITKKLERIGFKVKKSGPTYVPRVNKPTTAGARYLIAGSEVRTDHVIKPYVGYILAEKS